jgi:hypothetical protein
MRKIIIMFLALIISLDIFSNSFHLNDFVEAKKGNLEYSDGNGDLFLQQLDNVPKKNKKLIY